MEDIDEPPKIFDGQCRLLDIFFLASSSKKQNTRGLISGHYPILWHRSHCCQLPQTHISCCRLCLVLSGTLLFCLLAFFLCCFALAVTHGKRHRSSIFFIVLICRLAFLLNVEL